MAPVKSISTCEFISMLQRCKPPTGWPSTLGMNTMPGLTKLVTTPPSHRQLWRTGFYMPFVSLEKRLAQTQRTRRDSSGRMVREIVIAERGSSIPTLLFRNVSQGLKNISPSWYSSRILENPLGLSPLRGQTFPWSVF